MNKQIAAFLMLSALSVSALPDWRDDLVKEECKSNPDAEICKQETNESSVEMEESSHEAADVMSSLLRIQMHLTNLARALR